MTHPEDLLADYVNGSLTPSDRASVDEHLAGCRECSAEVSLARAARSALRDLPEIPVPDGVSSRALDAAGSPGRPGRYRWLGAGAAAAAVALLLVTLPHLASAPASQDKAEEALAGGSASSIAHADASALELAVQQTNYDQASLDDLTNATLRQATSSLQTATAGLPPANAAPNARIGTGAELQTALACVGKAVAADTGPPFKLILARFDGKAAFLAFYFGDSGEGQSPTSLVVWIVDGHTCTASGLSSSSP